MVATCGGTIPGGTALVNARRLHILRPPPTRPDLRTAPVHMRRLLHGPVALAVLATIASSPAQAQRGRGTLDPATRAAVDSFIVTMRDMAAWAVVTPAAHIPVGGLLDERGNVNSVVGTAPREEPFTAEPALVDFRALLGAGGRSQKSVAIGLGYRVHLDAARDSAAEGIRVEFEHRSGYRGVVTFPFRRTESGELRYRVETFAPGRLREIAAKRDVTAGPRTQALVTPVVDEDERDPARSAAPPTPARIEEVARRVVGAAPYPTFITTDATGRPQARTIQPSAPDSAWTVWFATNPRTRKVSEVQRDGRVALHWFDQSTLSYVTLIGRARVVRDRATKAAHWNAAWDAFYPDRDASVVLIAVDAERLEVVSSTLGVSGDAATWRPPTLRIAAPRRR